MNRRAWATPLTFALAAFASTTQAQSNNGQPQNIPFNSSGSRGPDGPWNYITLNIGSSPQSWVDFYPMTVSRASLLISSDACVSNQQCISPSPGYYNAKAQSQSDADSNTTTGAFSVFDNEMFTSVDSLQGSGYATVDTVNQPFSASNVTFALSSNVTSNYTDKRWVGLSLLSIEAVSNNISQMGNGRPTPGQKTLLQAYTDSTGGSASVGLHMGSARYNQSGSFYLGGFDQNRLIENPAIFDHVGVVNISSISYGHAAGLDPWAQATTRPLDNYISAVSSLGGNMSVDFKPQFATMRFPADLCNKLADSLPMKYDTETNLYLWNTAEPLYKALMTSPAYINFTFTSNPPVSIKIPFALLSLNLTTPIKDTPTAYFPCTPSAPNYALGRAFLQGANYVQCYSPPYQIIGQAPGPLVNGSASASVQTISTQNPAAVARPAPNAPRWNDTWAAHLTPLSSAPAYTTTPTSAPGSSNNDSSASNTLPPGAIAGIVIGIIAAIAIGAAAAFFFLKRRKQRGGPAVVAPLVEGQSQGFEKSGFWKAGGAHGVSGTQGRPVYEADEGHQLLEISAGNVPSQGFVSELPDNSLRAEADSHGYSGR